MTTYGREEEDEGSRTSGRNRRHAPEDRVEAGARDVEGASEEAEERGKEENDDEAESRRQEDGSEEDSSEVREARKRGEGRDRRRHRVGERAVDRTYDERPAPAVGGLA